MLSLAGHKIGSARSGGRKIRCKIGIETERGDSNKRVSNANCERLAGRRAPNFTEGMEKSVLLTFDHEGA
jgi:hypothetical protein